MPKRSGACLRGVIGLFSFAAILASASSAGAEPSAARGRLLFLRCASCHDISDAASPKIGPNLAGVYGRKAGSLPGYSYSAVMKHADLIWDEATLDRWLTEPNAVVPGTAMAFGGIASESDRAALIAYLRKPTP